MRKTLVLAATAAMLALSLSANAAVVVLGAGPSYDIDKISAQYDLVKHEVAYVLDTDDMAVVLTPGLRIPDGDGKYQLPAGAIAKSVAHLNRYEVPLRLGGGGGFDV